MSEIRIAIVDARKPPKELIKAANKSTFEWAEIVGDCKVYACHQAQLDILASRAKFQFAFAGSGGGKTCLIPLWLLKRIQENPKGRFLVVSPTVATFESSELKRHIIQTFEGTTYEGEWRDSKKTYSLPTGGEIVVKTCGDGGEFGRLTGGQYHAAIADECYLLSSEVWEEIRRRVSNHNGLILAVTTPTGNNWIYEVKQKAEKGDKDYYIRHWSKTANPTVSLEDVEREKTLMSEARYKRMIQGEFSAMEGLIYDCFGDPMDSRYPVIIGDPFKALPKALPSPPVRFFGGNDWGWKDPSAMLMIAECEDGVMYVVDEIYGANIKTDQLKKRALAMIDKWAVRIDPAYAIDGGRFGCFWTDVSRPEHTDAFKGSAIPIKNKRIADIEASIAVTDKWFRAGRLKIFSNCSNTIRELRSYQWQKDRSGGTKNVPKDVDNHLCDALRYSVSSQKYGQEPSIVERPIYDATMEVAKAERLGLLTPARIERTKEAEQQRLNEWTYRMMWAD